MVKFVRRRPQERYKEDCVIKTVKHPPSVMVWSCISSEGPGPIYFVDKIMNSDQYVRVLNTVFLPYLQSLQCSPTDYTFMQDGAPCHTSKKSINFINSKNVSILPWAGNSPDLNPIENCWAYLKSKVYSRKNSTIQMLKENIEDVWKNDSGIRDMVQACIASMPNRVHTVLKNKGNLTKY